MASRLWNIDAGHPGLVPDLMPETTLAHHAVLAITEHWAIALFGTWAGLARIYVADHYRPHPDASERLIDERRLRLQKDLRDVLELLEGEP